MRPLFTEFTESFFAAVRTIAPEDVTRAVRVLEQAQQAEGAIFVIGNGQSAATADAFALDLTKQTTPPPSKARFRTISLSSNVAALTAWGNDVRFESIFTEQLKSLYRPGDVLVAVSVSGSSPNVVEAGRWVKAQGGAVLAFTGFEGGALAELADANIWVRSRDYGYVETAHIAVMHYLVDYFRAALAE